MLFHQSMSAAYLTRRLKLFQVSSSQTRTSEVSSNESSQIVNKQKWLVDFGQNLANQAITMKKIKQTINSVTQQTIEKLSQSILEIIKLAFHFLLPSKISNTLYYLCRKSFSFRENLIIYLQSILLALCTSNQNEIKQKWCIILSDMFMFGIYFTQTEFITQIFSQIILKAIEPQKEIKNVSFFIHYIIQYFEALARPNILLEKYRSKFISTINQIMHSTTFQCIIELKEEMFHNLNQLRNIYLADDPQKQKEAQRIYIQSVRSYEKIRHSMRHALHVIVQSLQSISYPYTEYSQLMEKMAIQLPAVLQQTSPDLQQAYSQMEEQINYEQNNFQDNKALPLKNDKDCEKYLLQTVYNSCRYYKNRQFYYPENVYILKCDEATFPVFPVNNDGYSYVQALSDEYIEALRNCSDLQNSNKLADHFLSSFNKHANRVKLVDSIMMQMYERNNSAYIARVLAKVSQTQKQEIDDLVQQKLTQIKNKGSFKVGKGQYGRYSGIITELIKFNLISGQKYLLGLLEFINQMDGIQTENLSKIAKQNEESSVQTLTITQIISILQKLGRHTYYESLDCHILYNQIIDKVYKHIKNKLIGYDIETIHRFNGLVSFLRNFSKKNDNNNMVAVLPVSELANERNFRQIAKNFKNKVKYQEGILEICQIITSSIPNENHIYSYLYAQLIEQINIKNLDQQIKKSTRNNILCNFMEGNFQGAANWSRFFGQLHQYSIITQKQFINFLWKNIKQPFMGTNPNATIKMICSALETCLNYMKKTSKISQFEEGLQFLLRVKEQILKSGGLTIIIDHEINEIMQNFHAAFKYIETIEQCKQIRDNFQSYGRLQKTMNDFYSRQMDNQNKKVKEQKVDIQLKIINDLPKLLYKQKSQKYKEKQKDQTQVYSNEREREVESTNLMEQELLLKPQISEIETSSSGKSQGKKSETSSNENSKWDECVDELVRKIELQMKPKKIKVVGRSKNPNRKIQKVEIMLN